MRYALIALAFALAGCTAPAVISDISDSSLRVQAGLGTTKQQVQAKAAEGCNVYGKQPLRMSHKCMDEYCFKKTVLFACQ